MTREEAKKHLEWIPHFDEDKFINEVYNDFESRTCENCVYSSTASATDSLECKIGVDDNSLSSYHQLVNKGFGCNKFERKQNDN